MKKKRGNIWLTDQRAQGSMIQLIQLPEELHVQILQYLKPYELYQTNCIVYHFHLIKAHHQLYQLLSFFHAKPVEKIEYFPAEEFIIAFFKSGNHQNYQRFENTSRILLQLRDIKEIHRSSFSTLLYFLSFDFNTTYPLNCINQFIAAQQSIKEDTLQYLQQNKLVHFQQVEQNLTKLVPADSQTVVLLCKTSPRASIYISNEYDALRAIESNIQCILHVNINFIQHHASFITKLLLKSEGLKFTYDHCTLFQLLFASHQNLLVLALKNHPSLFQFLIIEVELLEYCLQQFSEEELRRFVPKWEPFFKNYEFSIVIPSSTYMSKLFRHCKDKETFLQLNKN